MLLQYLFSFLNKCLLCREIHVLCAAWSKPGEIHVLCAAWSKPGEIHVLCAAWSKPVALNSNIYWGSDYRVHFEAEILDIDTILGVGFKSVYLF